MENVILLNVSAVEQAQESVRLLRRLHDEGDIQLDAFAVVERREDGRITVLDQVEDVQITATAAGGVVGGIVGLLSGPLGLLIGGATGAVVGSLFDLAEAESSDDVLRNLAWAVPRGRAATIAVVTESAQTPVDARASDLGIAVLRRTRAESSPRSPKLKLPPSPGVTKRSPDARSASGCATSRRPPSIGADRALVAAVGL